jgi:hypothetical protein
VQPGRLSHHSGKSLHDHGSILSMVTRSVLCPTLWLPPHYLTYATVAGENEISFVPSRHYGGKSGGRGFRGRFSPSLSSFARVGGGGGGGVNEGKACFSFGVGTVNRCHNAPSTILFDEPMRCGNTRPAHLAATSSETTQKK